MLDAMAPVPAAALEAFARRLLAAHGLVDQHAAQVAAALMWAELRGTGSHGISRLPTYAAWLRSGEMNRAARPVFREAGPALGVLDADRAPGAVALDAAVQEVARMAAVCGCAAVIVQHTTHTGALGYTTERLALNGLVGIALAASGPNMIYHGAGVAAVSTAPLSIAVPRSPEPIVFDMASGATALGRILQARREGAELPPNVAANAHGEPTTDAAQAVAPLPLGGAKGSGLALVAELVCSVLAGAAILAPALAARGASQPHRQNALVLALDARRLHRADGAGTDVEALASAIHALPPLAGGEVLLPGERGSRERARRITHGVPVPPGVRAELEALAEPQGIACPWTVSS